MSEQKRLYAPKEIKRVMRDHNLQFNKNLGQNFLMDGNIVRKIVEKAEVSEEDVVIEIGPGIGILTEELLLKAKRVIAIEIDDKLIPVLQDNFADQDNFTLIHDDALKVDYVKVIEEYGQGAPIKVVANLPYYITTPLISLLLTTGLPIESCTVMVQKEVAERIVAKPSTKEYGSLSLYVDCFADASVVLNAPKEVFMPQPKVNSIVVKMVAKDGPEGVDREALTKLIHQSFQQRRKTIVNALSSAGDIDKKVLREALKELQLSPQLRPENLTLEDYINITRKLF